MPWYGFTFHGAPDLPDVTVAGVETGQIFLYPSSGAYDSTLMSYVTGPPEGFLRCDGSNVLITDYQDLYDFFVANGVSFGVAPVGYFKLPNMSGRWPVGLNTSDVDFDTIGKTGGSAGHSHTVADGGHTHTVPSHQHNVPQHRHSLSGHVFDNHSHTLPSHDHGLGTLGIPTTNSDNPLYAGSATTYAAGAHSHNISGTSDNTTGAVSGPKTGNTANNNLNLTEPYPDTNTAGFSDTSGAASSSTALNSTGADSIPPYKSFYFVIKV